MLSRTLVLPLLITFPVTVLAQTVTTPAEPPAAANSDTELAPLPPLDDASSTPSGPANSNSALDQPIRKIADTTDGCTVLDRDFPGLRAHPMYQFFKSMTLNQIAAMSHGRITQEMLRQAQTDLAALNMQAGATAAVPIAYSGCRACSGGCRAGDDSADAIGALNSGRRHRRTDRARSNRSRKCGRAVVIAIVPARGQFGVLPSRE